MQYSDEQKSRVATIAGLPGMCSDDGRALTYSWHIYTNDTYGSGFYEHAATRPTEEDARQWCDDNGYFVQDIRWG